MTEHQILAHAPQSDTEYTAAQLDGRACVRCESDEGPLMGNGIVRVPVRPGQTPLVYNVVACPGCFGRSLC
jgi:hypothetical protein